MATNICEFCDVSFEHERDDVTVCRSCYYGGKPLERQLAPVLAELRVVGDVGISHTGGGCFVIELPLGLPKPDGSRYIYLTDAEGELPDDDGMSEDQRWMVGFYDDARDARGLETMIETLESVTLEEAVDYCFARDALEQIAADYAGGQLQGWTGSWEDLHARVDANDYLLATVEDDGDLERAGRVEELIAERLGEIWRGKALDLHLSAEAAEIVLMALEHELFEAEANVDGSQFEPLAIREIITAIKPDYEFGTPPARPRPSEPASRHGNVEEPI